MARTANVFVMIEHEIKEQAEQVLDRPSIFMSDAVGMSAAGLLMPPTKSEYELKRKSK